METTRMNEYAQMIRKGVDFFGRYTMGVRFTDIKRTARYINVGTPPVTCEELEEARRMFNEEALRNIEKHGLDFVSEVVRRAFPYIPRQRLFNLFDMLARSQQLNAAEVLHKLISTNPMAVCEEPEAVEDPEEPDGHEEAPKAEAPTPASMPELMAMEKGRKLLERLEANGYCQKDGNGYKWAKSWALYGFMVDKASEMLYLRQEDGRLPWRIFAEVFNMPTNGERTAKNTVINYNKSGKKPNGAHTLGDIIYNI